MKKSSFLLYFVMFLLNFFVFNRLLFLLGVVLCVIGIWSKVFLTAGILAFVLDLFHSLYLVIRGMITINKKTDDPEWNSWSDTIKDGHEAIIDRVENIVQSGEGRVTDDHSSNANQSYLESLVVYRTQKSSIQDDMTLDQMVDAFEEMCNISVGEPDDLLYETGTYTFTGEKMFHLEIVRQFKFLSDDEYVQLRLAVIYPPSWKTKFLYRTMWGSIEEGNFFCNVRNSLAYKIVRNQSIHSVRVTVEET